MRKPLSRRRLVRLSTRQLNNLRELAARRHYFFDYIVMFIDDEIMKREYDQPDHDWDEQDRRAYQEELIENHRREF